MFPIQPPHLTDNTGISERITIACFPWRSPTITCSSTVSDPPRQSRRDQCIQWPHISILPLHPLTSAVSSEICMLQGDALWAAATSSQSSHRPCCVVLLMSPMTISYLVSNHYKFDSISENNGYLICL